MRTRPPPSGRRPRRSRHRAAHRRRPPRTPSRRSRPPRPAKARRRSPSGRRTGPPHARPTTRRATCSSSPAPRSPSGWPRWSRAWRRCGRSGGSAGGVAAAEPSEPRRAGAARRADARGGPCADAAVPARTGRAGHPGRPRRAVGRRAAGEPGRRERLRPPAPLLRRLGRAQRNRRQGQHLGHRAGEGGPMIDLSREYAAALDAADPLAPLRAAFVNEDPELIYLDGNSLGRLPKAGADRIAQVVRDEWGAGLIRSWNHWVDLPFRAGDLIGSALLGAAAGQVVVSDSSTVNLYKLSVAALDARPGRTVIVTDDDNFPTDRYVLEGLAAQRGLELRDVHTAIDAGADLAVGCTYKYLNGGPGAPAFLYVRQELQTRLRQPIWGWFGQRDQFAMGPSYDPVPGIDRILVGTPAVIGSAAVEEGVRLLAQAGSDRL